MTSAHDDLEKRVLDLVEQVLGVAADERESFIVEAAGGDDRLRDRAFEVLTRSSSTSHFLRTGAALERVVDEATPKEIGGYRIEAEIGRGGMGAVYLARRTDADFDHPVAIKVVRSAASDRLLERLRLERRTLARLKHPNIAQLYDGGETPNGEPFFIMEYARGLPLHRYLEQDSPSLEERLNIFSDICEGVAYAHKNLVIHRDLSPSNILVTHEKRVKLIDFGIAHSVEDSPKGDDVAPKLTMTKGYAAPERATGAPASTVTDVYSLGVILKEISDRLTAPRCADLEAISRKAAALAPEDRYPTVDALMTDITAYREGRAVAAVERTWTYEFARFVGRRKLAVGASALVAIAIVASSAVMSILYFRADAAELRAQQRFDEVRDLAGFMMFDLHDEIVRLEGSLAAREKLVATALDYLDSIGAASESSAALRVEIARGYQRFADVAGSPSSVNLGRRTQADELLGKAAQQIEAAWSASPDDAEVIRAYAQIFRKRGTLEWTSKGNFGKANRYFAAAADVLSPLLSSSAAKLEDRVLDGALDLSSSQALRLMGRYDEAVSASEDGISKLEALRAEHPDDFDVHFNLGHAYVYLGEAITSREWSLGNEPESALPPFNEGVAQLRSLYHAEDAAPLTGAQYVSALLKRGFTACMVEPSRAQGLADLSDAENLVLKMSATEGTNDLLRERLSYILYARSRCQYDLGQVDEAMATGERLLARRQAQVAREPENADYLHHLYNAVTLLARFSKKEGDWPAACVRFQYAADVQAQYMAALEKPADYQVDDIRELEADLQGCSQRFG